jgi:hypothetical protein
MNILTIKDAENYLKFKQVYFKKEVCNIDFQTQFEANRVHNLLQINIEEVRKNIYCLNINSENQCAFIYKECSKLELFAWIKVNFIPINELIEYCNQVF